MKDGRENKIALGLTGDRPFETGWRNGADATLVVNDLRDFGAIWHMCSCCNGTAHAIDIGLEEAIALCCPVTCLQRAVAADYEALEWLRRWGYHCGRKLEGRGGESRSGS